MKGETEWGMESGDRDGRGGGGSDSGDGGGAKEVAHGDEGWVVMVMERGLETQPIFLLLKDEAALVSYDRDHVCLHRAGRRQM